MDKQKKYSLRKIAGIGLTSCVVGISVMNMPVQAEEGTDAATTAVSETVENAEATSPSESSNETVAANNEATANEASNTAAEQPAVEEEAANPVEEAAKQPAAEEEATSPAEEAASQLSETEEVAPAVENIDAQPSNGEAAEANDKSNQLDSNNNDVIYGDGYNTWYISQYDKNKGELGRLKVNLTVDGKPYDYFNLVGYEGEVVTADLINQTIKKLGRTATGIPDGYQFEQDNNQSYTLHEAKSQDITFNLVRTNPSHEKVEFKFISKIYTGRGEEFVGIYNYYSVWAEKGSVITDGEIRDAFWKTVNMMPFRNNQPLKHWNFSGFSPEHDDFNGVPYYAGKDAYAVMPLIIGWDELEEIQLKNSENRSDEENARFLTVNILKDQQLLKSTRISGYVGDAVQPSDIAKALNDFKLPEGYKFAEENNVSYELTGTFANKQNLSFNIVPIQKNAENGEFTITIKDKSGKVYGQKTIQAAEGTALSTFEINNIAMQLKEGATFPTGTDIDPYDLFAGKPYYYVGKDTGYDYILNSVSKESNNTPSTDNKDPENNQNNTNSNGTTQPGNTSNDNGQTNTGGNANNQTGNTNNDNGQTNTGGNTNNQTGNTNNDNGQTNTGGDTNNQTGENGTATNQEGNTSQNSNNNDKGQKPSKSGNSQSETAGLSRLAARKAKEDLPKAGMKENSLALLGFALFALTGGVSAKRVFRKK